MGPEVFIETDTYLMAAVIDLDLTFVIQLAVFLLLYILLSNFFFKPYARYLARRDESTAGLKATAIDMMNRSNSIEQSTESRLEEARQAGIAERKKITAEAGALRDRLIEQERVRLQGRVDREVAELALAKQEFLRSAEPAVVQIADAIEGQIDAAEGGSR